MSDNIRDDSTPPGHGYAAFVEPFPLVSDAERALQKQINAGSAERDRLAAKVLRRGELLAACRTALRELGDENLIHRIDDEIGADAVIWTSFARGVVPVVGGHSMEGGT